MLCKTMNTFKACLLFCLWSVVCTEATRNSLTTKATIQKNFFTRTLIGTEDLQELNCSYENKTILCQWNNTEIRCKDLVNYTSSPELANDTFCNFSNSFQFNRPTNGEKYLLSACTNSVCKHSTLIVDPFIGKKILYNAATDETNLTIDYNHYKERGNVDKYYFTLLNLRNEHNNTVIVKGVNDSRKVSFDNLSPGSPYKVEVYSSSHGSNSSKVSKIFLTKPLNINLRCYEKTQEISVLVENVPYRSDFHHAEFACRNERLCHINHNNITFYNLKGGTQYNLTVNMTLRVDDDYGYEVFVVNTTTCLTRIDKPVRSRECYFNVPKIYEIDDSSVNITMTQIFTDDNGPIRKLYLLVERKKDGGIYNEYDKKEINNYTGVCSEISPYVIRNLLSGEYMVYLKAENTDGESSESDRSLFIVDNENKQLFVVLGIIIVLLIVVILFLAYLLCRCRNQQEPRRMNVTKQSTSFSKFIHSKARTMKILSHRLSHHPVIRNPVHVSDFVAYVDELEKDSGLKYSEEFDDLRMIGRNQPTEDALLQCNRLKNRFTNILPYDVTRARLQMIEDEEGSDYINANWIAGYISKREYIATQGPLTSTVDDFWRMVWEHKSPAIVMLTLCIEKNKIKCDCYWPSESPTTYGEVQVSPVEEKEDQLWHTREFKLEKDDETRTLKQFHFLNWPDMNVPDADSLLSFINFFQESIKDLQASEETLGPIIVHCSAGVGRSGTFIALDILLRQIRNKNGSEIDIFETVRQMRMSRILMVQTEQQYTFLYRCLKQVLEKSSMCDQPNHVSCDLQIHQNDEDGQHSRGVKNQLIEDHKILLVDETNENENGSSATIKLENHDQHGVAEDASQDDTSALAECLTKV